MYLKTDRITVEVGGVRFTSFQTALPQFVLDPTAVVGWDDGVEVRRSVTVRPTTWGDFAETGRMGPRTVSLSGTAVANTARELGEMRSKFASILNEGEYGEMWLEDGYDKRFLPVGLEGSSTWVRQTDTVASWRIDFYAPDPRLLGEVKRETIGAATTEIGLTYPLVYPLSYSMGDTDQTKTIRNIGNTDSWPTFKVTGTFPKGFTITNGRNRTVSYSGMVTMQSPVEIDMYKGTATQSGVDKTVLLTKREWFSIPAESSIRPVFTPTSSVTYSAPLASPVVNGVHRLNGVDYRACAMEDSRNCFWDAKAQGNGVGRSFTNVNGTIFYWDELAGPVVNVPASGWCDIIYRDTWI